MIYDAYRAQLAVYLVLVEETYGIRPPYGVLVLGDGRRVRVENTESLRIWVMHVAEDIREGRRAMDTPLPPTSNPRQCVACGFKGHCTQRRV